METPTIKDSGERQAFATGAVRDTQTGKGRFDLLPVDAIFAVAQHFEAGARKYADRNWEKGIPLSRFLDSGLRHTLKLLRGDTDEPHAEAAAWNLLCFIQTRTWIAQGVLPSSLDDLPRRVSQAVPSSPDPGEVEYPTETVQSSLPGGFFTADDIQSLLHFLHLVAPEAKTVHDAIQHLGELDGRVQRAAGAVKQDSQAEAAYAEKARVVYGENLDTPFVDEADLYSASQAVTVGVEVVEDPAVYVMRGLAPFPDREAGVARRCFWASTLRSDYAFVEFIGEQGHFVGRDGIRYHNPHPLEAYTNDSDWREI